MEELGWNLLSFWDCLKVCKMLMHLMFTVEAPNLAQNCTRWCSIDTRFKKYANICRLVTIATWMIQCHPYPQSSRFSHLTYFSHIRQRPSLIVLIWLCVCVCFWALQIHWHTLQTSKHDIKAGICQNAVKFALILSVQKYVRHSYTSCLQ